MLAYEAGYQRRIVKEAGVWDVLRIPFTRASQAVSRTGAGNTAKQLRSLMAQEGMNLKSVANKGGKITANVHSATGTLGDEEALKSIAQLAKKIVPKGGKLTKGNLRTMSQGGGSLPLAGLKGFGQGVGEVAGQYPLSTAAATGLTGAAAGYGLGSKKEPRGVYA